MIVEEDAGYREELTCSLESALNDYQIDTVKDNRQLTQYITHIFPSLILWDVDALKNSKNGSIEMNTLEKVKENPVSREIPIVALAGSLDEDLIIRCYHMGIRAFVVKPKNQPELTALIHVIHSYGSSPTRLMYYLTHLS